MLHQRITGQQQHNDSSSDQIAPYCLPRTPLETLRVDIRRQDISKYFVNLRALIQDQKMRLPYAPTTAPSNDAATQDIYARVAARRSPRPLQALDLTLLHAPAVADGWNGFLGAIRTRTSLPADVREVAICRVAVLNGARYEWEHHAPLARAAGVSDDGIRVLAGDAPGFLDGPEAHRGEGDAVAEALSPKLWAVVKYTDAMTRDVRVPDEVFEELRSCFGEQEVVEITATVAAYNCVSRFLVALDVGERNETAATTVQ
ncbi:MAG: hypothetical protein M1818_007490 [Claussenomyces sp. TS43310]|nr:MAG: hypothetical protein M1818_007490 [Claussenomyces sp. TS43310]